MKTSAVWVGVVLLVLAACSKKEPVGKPDATASGNPVTAPVDYLGAVAKAKRVSEKTVDTASLNQAIQLFYAQEDRFPKDLNELAAQHYIAAVPQAPVGMRWEYSPQNGTLKAVRVQ